MSFIKTNPLQTGIFYYTLRFLKQHFTVIFILGLIAGTGRVLQLNGFGETGPEADLILEVIVESARLLLLIYVTGSASFRNGFSRLFRVFKKTGIKKQIARRLWINIRAQWRPILLNCILFAALAWGINLMIDQLAYETCFYLRLKQEGMLSSDASEWTIILFFKNLTVIPLTLVFEVMLLFCILGKMNLTNIKTFDSSILH